MEAIPVEILNKLKLDKLMDILMPEVETLESQTAKVVEMPQVQQEETTQVRQAVNGDAVYYNGGLEAQHEASSIRHKNKRPNLTVHTTKIPELDVQVYVPMDFDQVTAIADDLKAGKAAIVNYEHVDAAMQRRICDFINGSCYVIDGEAKRISEAMVLYVPANVNVNEMRAVPVTD